MYVDKAGKLASVDPLFELAREDTLFQLACVDQRLVNKLRQISSD